ncbi:unnamed protein product [Cyclocybe aegerita]|uniref:Aminoglycoside phosphotransferase domain-containing protein n=1 Tax=Cyclocybe aegerita TaxID=1973307 RepID=A0A8S0VSH0_CYCAE|nr:unnamed protein product [Cyclocybe aegerita]
MAHLPFNFHAYLENQTGAKGWQVEELSGGAANYTVRVGFPKNDNNPSEKLSPGIVLSDSFDALFTSVSSVVIKQAPPFLAKHPEIPCSPQRQVIEAEALKAFRLTLGVGGASTLPHVLPQNPCIMVPRLLLYDSSNNILVQSDLGSLPNLYDVLTNPETAPSLSSQLGEIAGHFLADMHDPSILDSISADKFVNEDSDRVMEAVIAEAARHMRDAGIPDFKSLGQAALKHWRTRQKTVFAQGDIWFGTLLIDLEAPLMRTDVDKNPHTVAVGICDWEFAGPNDAAADVAQLGSYLHLLSLSEMATLGPHETIAGFAEAFYSTYFKTLKSPPNADFWRSLLIMHGWEMINAAGWGSRQHLWCHCEGSGVRCNHIRTIIEEGAEILREAADPRDESMSHKLIQRRSLEEIPWVRRFWPDLIRSKGAVPA